MRCSLSRWRNSGKRVTRAARSVSSVTIAPRGYLVVFASNKDRRIPGEELHTNFALSAGGEFLALVCEVGRNRGVGIDPAFVAERLETRLVDEAGQLQLAQLCCCRVIADKGLDGSVGRNRDVIRADAATAARDPGTTGGGIGAAGAPRAERACGRGAARHG